MSGGSLILVAGDQLSPDMSSLRSSDRETDVVLMAELQDEATYVRHHKKKIAFLFSAMRHFARALEYDGWTVDYVTLDEKDNTGSFTGEVGRAIDRHGPEKIVMTEPGEWRVEEMTRAWETEFKVPVEILDDTRFVCSRKEFANWAEGRKQLRMEHFYREMRKRTGLLMEDGKPAGGKWNFDKENRKPADSDLVMPQPARTEPDAITEQVIDLVEARFGGHFGKLTPFWFAVSAQQAEAALDRFVAEALPCFGDYQDAMLEDERFLYHSVLSAYINAGLLDPLEVCRRVEAAYDAGDVPVNAAEGFIRQIIGWREYVRGIYWLKMPGYEDSNALDAARDLPEFYWTGETDMACLASAVTQTIDEAYAHHIQRLMLTGNFAMLAGVEPRQVHEWYLMVYADAYEWVELPNTVGMSQFADGGLLASKPYAASGNYINKMSDHCGSCRYDVKEKTSSGACPFNALYWDFLARNAGTLKENPRLARAYSTWERMSEEKHAAYRKRAADVLAALDAGRL